MHRSSSQGVNMCEERAGCGASPRHSATFKGSRSPIVEAAHLKRAQCHCKSGREQWLMWSDECGLRNPGRGHSQFRTQSARVAQRAGANPAAGTNFACCARSSKRAGGLITRIALDECRDPERYRTRVPVQLSPLIAKLLERPSHEEFSRWKRPARGE